MDLANYRSAGLVSSQAAFEKDRDEQISKGTLRPQSTNDIFPAAKDRAVSISLSLRGTREHRYLQGM